MKTKPALCTTRSEEPSSGVRPRRILRFSPWPARESPMPTRAMQQSIGSEAANSSPSTPAMATHPQAAGEPVRTLLRRPRSFPPGSSTHQAWTAPRRPFRNCACGWRWLKAPRLSRGSFESRVGPQTGLQEHPGPQNGWCRRRPSRTARAPARDFPQFRMPR
jgi:hypothetical protein